MSGRVLLVSGDRDLHQQVSDWLSDLVWLQGADTIAVATRICAEHPVDVVVLAGDDGILADWLRRTPSTDGPRIVLLTRSPSYEVAVHALRSGALDCLRLPLDKAALIRAVERALQTGALQQSAEIQGYQTSQERRGTVLVGSSDAMVSVTRLIDLAATVQAPVFITGETGTGKNVVASAIHYRSTVRRDVFLGINCGALAPNLIEAELFGYEKGAFTGAAQTHRGIFEMASGGTLFLDEIAELPPNLQAKLLGVLEDHHVRRLGGGRFIPVDVRLIAAACAGPDGKLHRNLRQDLFFRLSVIRIHMVPLRERREDIPELCDHFLGTLVSGRRLHFSREEGERIAAYDWPGNVRELKNVIERACITQPGPELFPSRLLDAGVAKQHTLIPAAQIERIQTLEEVQRDHIAQVLRRCAFNQTRTARALGISLSTLKRKLKRYGLK